MSETGSSSNRIDRIEGRAVPLRGDNIDTDRIVPARFLRAVTFEGLDHHLFEDDRKALEAAGAVHPFSNPAYRGAAILLAGANFGCGSSREHAPQGLLRWGIRASVGESFSEIFCGNAATLGMPCFTAPREEIDALMRLVEDAPATILTVSVGDLTLRAGDRVVPVSLPPAIRESLLSGLWDATGLLVERYEDVEAVAARLPYIGGF